MSKGILGVTALTVATDLILALSPLTFIERIHRSVRERVILAIIMRLGLVASAVSICKIASVSSSYSIIAACVPCIKHLIERGLVRVGLISRRCGRTLYHLDNNHSSRAKAKGSSRPHIHQAGEPRVFDTGTATSTEDEG